MERKGQKKKGIRAEKQKKRMGRERKRQTQKKAAKK